jgi:hypothetical protein
LLDGDSKIEKFWRVFFCCGCLCLVLAMASNVGRGWKRSLEIYGVLFASLGVGSSAVHYIVRPDLSVPAALNLDVDSQAILAKQERETKK